MPTLEQVCDEAYALEYKHPLTMPQRTIVAE
jgi:hypothetical protein